MFPGSDIVTTENNERKSPVILSFIFDHLLILDLLVSAITAFNLVYSVFKTLESKSAINHVLSSCAFFNF